MQRQRCQISLQHLRVALRRQLLVLLRRPQSIANTRLQSPGAASPLFGRSAGNPAGLQGAHTGHRIKGRFTRQARVYHHANAFDGQTGLGNRGRQHNFAFALWRWRNRTALRGQIEIAIQGREQHVWLIAQRLLQPRQHPPNLRHARQKHQHAARLFINRAQNGLHHVCVIRPAQCRRGAITNIHRILTALTGDDRRIVEQPADPVSVQCRRHHQQPQRRIITQVLLGLHAQRQPQIGIQTALVKFIEDHHANARQLRVILQQALQYPLGHHLNAGCRADLAFQPDAIPDGLPHRLTQQLGQTLSRRSGCQPAGFEHDDLLPSEPFALEQRQRHLGGFAGTGRGLQHHRVLRTESLLKLGQYLRNGQVVHGAWTD